MGGGRWGEKGEGGDTFRLIITISSLHLVVIPLPSLLTLLGLRATQPSFIPSLSPLLYG